MSKGRILIADDSRLSRSLCTDILVEDGFQIEAASNGQEALDLIRTGEVDLVILDLVLPDISGQDVLKRARQTKAAFLSTARYFAWMMPFPVNFE